MSLTYSLSLPLCPQDEKMNVEALSRGELLTLLSVLEGELEAQDVVIHALRVSIDTFIHIAEHLTCIWEQSYVIKAEKQY